VATVLFFVEWTRFGKGGKAVDSLHPHNTNPERQRADSKILAPDNAFCRLPAIPSLCAGLVKKCLPSFVRGIGVCQVTDLQLCPQRIGGGGPGHGAGRTLLVVEIPPRRIHPARQPHAKAQRRKVDLAELAEAEDRRMHLATTVDFFASLLAAHNALFLAGASPAAGIGCLPA
jgi:hypothetical protein